MREGEKHMLYLSRVTEPICVFSQREELSVSRLSLGKYTKRVNNDLSKMSGSLTGIVTHTRKVQSLYKRALRMLENWYDRREVYRYHAVLMRQRFDENKEINDLRIAKDLVAKGETELFDNQHWHPRKFPDSPGGVAYGREVEPPDWVVDYWHPLEKAQYPEYFARREQRKKEFVKMWEEKYGKSSSFMPH